MSWACGSFLDSQFLLDLSQARDLPAPPFLTQMCPGHFHHALARLLCCGCPNSEMVRRAGALEFPASPTLPLPQSPG
jgi:hypothetical protein